MTWAVKLLSKIHGDNIHSFLTYPKWYVDKGPLCKSRFKHINFMFLLLKCMIQNYDLSNGEVADVNNNKLDLKVKCYLQGDRYVLLIEHNQHKCVMSAKNNIYVITIGKYYFIYNSNNKTDSCGKISKINWGPEYDLHHEMNNAMLIMNKHEYIIDDVITKIFNDRVATCITMMTELYGKFCYSNMNEIKHLMTMPTEFLITYIWIICDQNKYVINDDTYMINWGSDSFTMKVSDHLVYVQYICDGRMIKFSQCENGYTCDNGEITQTLVFD